MIYLDYTVFIQIVAFIVLWFLLSKLLFKPFLGLIEERERRTEGVKAEAQALVEEGERLRAEYESAIAKVREEGNAVKEAVLNEARQKRERLLAQAREEAAGHLATVREEIREELARGRQAAVREAEAIAREMAEKVLGRKIA